jgi:hypothetical protein
MTRSLRICILGVAALAVSLEACSRPTPSEDPGPVPAPAATDEPAVFISELMAANDRSFCDNVGDDPDWVELHNPSPKPLDLGGWALTDRPLNQPQRWRFPPQTVIPGGGYMALFFRTKNPDPKKVYSDKDLRIGFRLDAAAEDLVLINPLGVEVHRVRFSEQLRDVSIGTSSRFAPAVPLQWPTPGLPNDAARPPSGCPAQAK